MAKWGGPTPSKRPPVKKYLYLYLQCDCEDSEYGPAKGFSPEAFMARYVKSRQVYVASPTDFLIPVGMSEDRELDRCVWLNKLGQYEFVTMTRDKTNRTHKVHATIDGGMETEWVCKHCICVARWLGRRMWNVRHLFVHLVNDPELEERLKSGVLDGDDLSKAKRMWLTRHVCVTGWGEWDYKSRLFGQKGEEG